jgi:hypothetical protein
VVEKANQSSLALWNVHMTDWITYHTSHQCIITCWPVGDASYKETEKHVFLPSRAPSQSYIHDVSPILNRYVLTNHIVVPNSRVLLLLLCLSCRWSENMSLNYEHERTHYPPQIMYVGLDPRRNDIDRENWRTQENLSQCHFIHHKSNLGLCGER